MTATASEAKMVRRTEREDGRGTVNARRNEREADGCGWMRSQADFEKRVDPNNKEQMSLLEEMRKHTEKVRTHARFMCDAADATPVPHARG